MSDFEILRRQVAIGGIARDPSGVLAGNLVQIRRKGEEALVSEHVCRVDGSFFFLDLPDGNYTVTALAHGNEVSKDATVARDVTDTLRMVWIDLQLGIT
ncbi:MAG TPA: hypothetical protein VFW30_05690 [Bryocella sp.]|nr:hypothetical protein [Bryocella sp.]